MPFVFICNSKDCENNGVEIQHHAITSYVKDDKITYREAICSKCGDQMQLQNHDNGFPSNYRNKKNINFHKGGSEGYLGRKNYFMGPKVSKK